DRRQEVAGAVEYQDHVVARVADEHLARRRGAGRIAERDARGKRELARARAGDARPAVGRADLAVRRAVGDPPPKRGDELSLGVELLHTRVAAIGDVDGAARLLDGHTDRRLELAGGGAGAGERGALDQERQERLERLVGAVRRPGRVRRHHPEVIGRLRLEAGHVRARVLLIEARAEIGGGGVHARRRVFAGGPVGGRIVLLGVAGGCDRAGGERWGGTAGDRRLC